MPLKQVRGGSAVLARSSVMEVGDPEKYHSAVPAGVTPGWRAEWPTSARRVVARPLW